MGLRGVYGGSTGTLGRRELGGDIRRRYFHCPPPTVLFLGPQLGFMGDGTAAFWGGHAGWLECRGVPHRDGVDTDDMARGSSDSPRIPWEHLWGSEPQACPRHCPLRPFWQDQRHRQPRGLWELCRDPQLDPRPERPDPVQCRDCLSSWPWRGACSSRWGPWGRRGRRWRRGRQTNQHPESDNRLQ